MQRQLRFTRRDGVRLAYELRGSGGPLCMLVQGLGMPGRLWLGLPGGLLRQGWSVLIPDNRGTGSSDAPLPPYRMRDLADDLAAVVEAAGRRPALVMGISLGGMISQHLALRHPSLVAGMVLAATTCGPPVGRMVSLGFLPLLARTRRGDPAALEAMRRRLVHRSALEANPRIFAAWDHEIQKEPTGWRGMLGQLAAAAGHSTGFRLGQIRCPVEVIAGDDDRIVPVENSHILAQRIAGAALTILPDCGHAFPLERPDALGAAADRVLKRIEQEDRKSSL
jgi:3-oxoadipate enol-lactonase